MLTKWGIAALTVATMVIVWTNAERYMDPVGEKYIIVLRPGSADFFPPFAGARALLRGENPYHNRVPEFADPWGRDLVIGGLEYRGHYPPTYLLLCVPLALVTEDWRQAGRILFGLNVLSLLALAGLTWWLLVEMTGCRGPERRMSTLLIPVLFANFTLNLPSSLALERGDGGDILAALLLWGGIVLFLRGRISLSLFLVVLGTLIKGYGAILAVGLLAFSLATGSWKRALAGTLASAALFLLPVIRYLPDSFAWIHMRVADITTPPQYVWMNHSFRHAFETLAPALAELGQQAMTGLVLATGLVCWVRTWRALRTGDARQAAFWMSLFATCGLMPLLAAARVAFMYNLVLILPGLFVFLLRGATVVEAPRPGRLVVPVMGMLQILTAAFFFKGRGGAGGVSLTGLALVLMILVLAGSLLWEWLSTRRVDPPITDLTGG